MKLLIILSIIFVLWLSIILLTIIEVHLFNKVLKILLKLNMLFLIVVAVILILFTLFYSEIHFK